MAWFLLSLLLSVASAQAAPLRVLITGFEPYDGRRENGSALVAAELKKLSSATNVEFRTCILPVEFDVATRRAEACYQRQKPKPDLVLALGEGECDTEIEVSANNMLIDFIKGDAKGKKKFGPMDPKAPPEELLSVPVPEMFCATGVNLRAGLRVSASPGYFVCNEIAYRMARFYKPRKIPFGFLHVPAPGRCEQKHASPAEVAGLVRTMALAAAKAWNETAGIEQRVLPLPCATEEEASELARIEQNSNQLCLAAIRAEVEQQQAIERAKRPRAPDPQDSEEERIEF